MTHSDCRREILIDQWAPIQGLQAVGQPAAGHGPHMFFGTAGWLSTIEPAPASTARATVQLYCSTPSRLIRHRTCSELEVRTARLLSWKFRHASSNGRPSHRAASNSCFGVGGQFLVITGSPARRNPVEMVHHPDSRHEGADVGEDVTEAQPGGEVLAKFEGRTPLDAGGRR